MRASADPTGWAGSAVNGRRPIRSCVPGKAGRVRPGLARQSRRRTLGVRCRSGMLFLAWFVRGRFAPERSPDLCLPATDARAKCGGTSLRWRHRLRQSGHGRSPQRFGSVSPRWGCGRCVRFQRYIATQTLRSFRPASERSSSRRLVFSPPSRARPVATELVAQISRCRRHSLDPIP